MRISPAQPVRPRPVRPVRPHGSFRLNGFAQRGMDGGTSEYGAISLSSSRRRTDATYRSAFVRHSPTYSDVLHASPPPAPAPSSSSVRFLSVVGGPGGRGENFAKLLQPTLAKVFDQNVSEVVNFSGCCNDEASPCALHNFCLVCLFLNPSTVLISESNIQEAKT